MDDRRQQQPQHVDLVVENPQHQPDFIVTAAPPSSGGGFFFQPRAGRLRLREISRVDVDELVQNVDVEVIVVVVGWMVVV